MKNPFRTKIKITSRVDLNGNLWYRYKIVLWLGTTISSKIEYSSKEQCLKEARLQASTLRSETYEVEN